MRPCNLVLLCTVGRGQKLASDWVKEKGAMSWEELERDTTSALAAGSVMCAGNVSARDALDVALEAGACVWIPCQTEVWRPGVVVDGRAMEPCVVVDVGPAENGSLCRSHASCCRDASAGVTRYRAFTSAAFRSTSRTRP